MAGPGVLVHLGHGGLIVAFPLFLLVQWGWGLGGLFDLVGAPWWQVVVAVYFAACVVVGLVWLPAVTAPATASEGRAP